MHLQLNDIETCRRIHQQFGPNYYFATRLFPRDLRQAVWVLYAFVRVPDELVDNPIDDDPQAVRHTLEDWQAHWQKAYETGDSHEPVLRAAAVLFHRYGIPFQHSEAFLSAMIQDTHKQRYSNFEELKHYMYGSAAVVGLMMTHIIGCDDQQAFEHAESLGYAMQLTNFLRDLREDYQQRNRIYVPQDELESFGLTEADIVDGNVSDAFVRFMQFQLERTHTLYAHADEGIPLLARRGRLPVKLARQLYSAIDRKIEQQQYDVFSQRASTSFLEKVLLGLKVCCGVGSSKRRVQSEDVGLRK